MLLDSNLWGQVFVCRFVESPFRQPVLFRLTIQCLLRKRNFVCGVHARLLGKDWNFMLLFERARLSGKAQGWMI